MTVQISLPGQLASLQFGVNEISSALSVHKWVGSFLSASRDSAIFSALEEQYGVFLERLPEILHNVRLDRSGTILGSGQRQITSKSMLPNIKLSSVTGIATFIILILRYVETPDDIVDYIQALLKGEFGTIRGGQLEPKGSGRPKETLPYAIRDNLRTYITGILDADADSDQHRNCLQWFSQLSALAGRARHVSTFSRYSHLDHRRLLRHLLSHSNSNDSCHSTPFHTLSKGTAMIALAAMANGANISLHCVTSDQGRVAIPHCRTRNTDTMPLSVTLWLIEPPEDVLQQIQDHKTAHKRFREDPGYRMIPIYGGDAEVSWAIAQQLNCKQEPEDCLRLWKEGVQVGKNASWEANSSNPHDIILGLSQAFTQTDIPAHVAPLAKMWYSGPASDKRHQLARKAANVFDQVYGYSDYSCIQPDEAKRSLNLILAAFAIGCLKSLVSRTSKPLSSYAMTLEELDGPGTGARTLLDFCEKLITGHTIFDILFTAGSVWGGLRPRIGFPEGRLVGIACPDVVILLDVLNDPKSVAEYGLTKGLMSFYTGSIPILPRDPHYGAILAADPNPELYFQTVNAARTPLPKTEMSELIFTLEPFPQANGALSAVVCAWESGDVIFQLNPFNLLQNMVYKRTLELADAEPTSEDRLLRREIRVRQEHKMVPISHDELADLQYFKLERVVGVIDAGRRVSWQVAAAGCALPGTAIMVVEADECESLRSGTFDLNRVASDTSLILCSAEGPIDLD